MCVMGTKTQESLIAKPVLFPLVSTYLTDFERRVSPNLRVQGTRIEIREFGKEPQHIHKENVGESEEKVLVAGGVCRLHG